MTWQRGGHVNNHRFRIGPPTSVYRTLLFEPLKDPTTLAWRLWHHIFHPCRTGALEIMARPRTIFTPRHPDPIEDQGPRYITHVTLETRLALIFQRANIEKLGGAWGRGCYKGVWEYAPLMRPFEVQNSVIHMHIKKGRPFPFNRLKSMVSLLSLWKCNSINNAVIYSCVRVVILLNHYSKVDTCFMRLRWHMVYWMSFFNINSNNY